MARPNRDTEEANVEAVDTDNGDDNGDADSSDYTSSSEDSEEDEVWLWTYPISLLTLLSGNQSINPIQ